jgi:hypothetical protein
MRATQRYKVFYTFLESRRGVSSDAPVTMSLEEVCTDLFPRLQHHDDFLGLVDQDGGCFQIQIYGGFLLDVPLPSRQGSLELLVDEKEALQRLKRIPKKITAEAFPDFTFEPWPPPAKSKPWWRFW